MVSKVILYEVFARSKKKVSPVEFLVTKVVFDLSNIPTELDMRHGGILKSVYA